MRLRNLIIAILLGAALAVGLFVATKMSTPAKPLAAFIIPTPGELPEFSLMDQSGTLVNADTFRGQWDLLFFGYTNCPDICPTTLQTLATVKRKLVEAGSQTPPRIVFVSVDPERDTPEIIGQYVDYFGADNLAVTGDPAEIMKLTTALGIYFRKVPGDDANYDVEHSAAVLLLDPDGSFSALFSAPQIVANYLHDLPIIMGDR